MNHQDKRLQPVTYGSIIYLSTESSLKNFMFSDGFMDNKVTLKAQDGIIGNISGYHDFTFCLFMVLPFANSACFDVQGKIISDWRDKLLNNPNNDKVSPKLEDRKSIVAELKNKLESELQFNIGTLQKSKGSNICFGSSNFMLLHINSLKYLTLNQDDNSNLMYAINIIIDSLELHENPNKNSFFNFDPSLKLQRGRSDNFVYEDEIVYISCTEKFSGKSPFLTVKYSDSESVGLARDEEWIVGAIDEKENWKVNIYEEPLEESASQNMRIGSCVWILLSEKLQFLVGQRDVDPFLELYEYPHHVLNRMPKSPTKGSDLHLSRLDALYSKKRDLTEGFLEDPRKHLYDELKMKVILGEIKQQSDKAGETEELSSFGLWKIEDVNVKHGGELRWNEKYRLKHLVTGLYLSVNTPINKKLVESPSIKVQGVVSLSIGKGDNTLFQFVPIENLISYQNKTQTRGLIQKDAFFMIQNFLTKQYVGIYDKSDSEQEDRSEKSPVLFDYVKDVNTFRFREAKFSCIWENYSLVSTFPVLFQLISNTMDSSKMVGELNKETLDKKNTFVSCYGQSVPIMQFFVDFLLNRILSNINLEQEIMYPSAVRQSKFHQQFLLGLLCWMLTIIFPSFDEFEKQQISPQEESLGILTNPQLLKSIKSTLKRRNGYQNIKNSSKVGQEHLLQKYNIARLCYKVLQTACYQNPDNQEFVFKFLPKHSDHFGFGEFVSQSFQIIFKDNFKILHQIHREQFPVKDDQGKPTVFVFAYKTPIQNQSEHIFQVITGRLKLFEPYKKIEILQLLGAFTHIGKSSIYINQEKVFSSIVVNKNFLFGHLLKLICERDTSIQIEFREFINKEFISRQLEMVHFCDVNKDATMLKYFMVQLKLYALLCQSRNYACVKNMQELLPQKVLLSYLSDATLRDKLTDEFRSIICLMMLNLYVDKEPRTIINKPNYVRVFRPPKHHSFKDKLNPMKFLQLNKHKNKVKALPQEDSPGRASQYHDSDKPKDDDLTARVIEINLSDDITGAYEIREWLLDYLEQRTKLILQQDDTPALISKVYNQLTFEVIRTLSIMVKFGLFTAYATKLMQDSQQHDPKRRTSSVPDDEELTHLERLTQMLAYLLEFDQTYFRELRRHDFKRTYIGLQKRKVLVNLFDGGIGIVGGLFVQSPKIEEEEEEDTITRSSGEQDEYQNHQFLRRYQSLLKIIAKFTNKTYTNEEFVIRVEGDIQVSIKREICAIFDVLLDWRSDQFMENAIEYYKKKFYGRLDAHECDVKALKSLMPDLPLNPGKAMSSKHLTYKRRTATNEEVRDLDVVLDRPFVEVLLVSFYFSQQPDLQNSIANLLTKIYSQRERLLRNIQKISLVDAESGSPSYTKLSALMNKLKGLLSYSQSWLQIIEQNYYDEKAEETLTQTLDKLDKMASLFGEQTSLIIKQKVFKHLAGHKLVLKFIEQGTTVIDSKVDYFREDLETTQFSYKNQFIGKVKLTFELCHQILSTFAEDNLTNQNSLYKHYGQLLLNTVNINIGQVEFLCNLFRRNLALCMLPQALYFDFTVGLIRDHGHYAAFINIFGVFLEAAEERRDHLDIQKQILLTLHGEDNIDAVNPFNHKHLRGNKQLPQFYREPPDEHLYLVAYLQCIHDCIRVDVGINYIIKVNRRLTVPTLLELLLTLARTPDANQHLIVYVCDILHIFFAKLDAAIDQFQDGATFFIQLLELQMHSLNSHTPLNKLEMQFLTQHVLGLVNVYFDHFLKEIGMIALKMLSNDPAVQKERKVFEFAQIVTENLDQLYTYFEGTGSFVVSSAQQATNMARFATNFNLHIPERFTQLHSSMSRERLNQSMVTENNDLEEILHPNHKLNKKNSAVLQNAQRKLKVAVDVMSLSKLLPRQTTQHHRPTDFTQNWTSFVEMLVASPHVKASIKEERLKFPDVIMSVQCMFEGNEDARQREMLISSDDTITKLLQYIQYWKARGANRNTIIFVLKSIRALVSVNQSAKEKAQQQCHLDGLNATSIALRLYWMDKATQDQYIYQLIKFIIELLDGGNKSIQMSILMLFKTNQDSEAFFRKIFNVLVAEMNSTRRKQVQSQQMLTLQTTQRKFTEKTLRVVQLLCEGHNNALQNYLRQQTNSKISYDLVSLMVKLVLHHKLSNSTYASVLQCVETLTEVVQGPCKENQMVIVTSKFLEWSIDLLREDDKLFDVMVEGSGGDILTNQELQSSSPLHHEADSRVPDNVVDSIQDRAHKHQGKSVIAIHRGLLVRLKYKCTIMLLSLLEMQDNNEEIVNRLIRSIPCSILANELAKVHGVYKLVYGEDYVMEAFNRHSRPLDKEASAANELVVEYGFNLFILVNVLITKNKKPQEAELADIQQIIEEYQYVKEAQDDSLSELTNIGSSFLASGLRALKNLSIGGQDSSGSQELAIERERLKMQKKAFIFFSHNTATIEVIRDEQLIRLYFPLMPHCRHLPQESRKQFHENLDHSSTRDKLTHLMLKADHMIEVLQHEEDLRRIFKKNKILEFIANHKALWENLAFIANIVVNLTILVSYNQYTYTDGLAGKPDATLLHEARLYEPRFMFHQEYTFTSDMIRAMGLITLALSSLVIFFFFLKRAPLLLKKMWRRFMVFEGPWWAVSALFIKTIVNSIFACCTDFEFVYYSFFMACLILGLLVHPFIFVFLLVDFLRIQTIKIVAKSIWISKKAMMLTFIVFLLVEYYFTIISFVYLYDQYPVGPCTQVWECFLVTFDQTFKNGGAIGEYMVDTQRATTNLTMFPIGQLPINYIRSVDQQDRYVYRVIYDDSFKFLLRFIIINMVAGIIIDTFGALKDAMLETERNLTEFCFICGIEKEKLDKATPHGYHSHIVKDHHMWNYVYFKAYLNEKPQTEFTGNDTYIRTQFNKKDIDWFPVKRAMGVTDEDEEDDNTEKIQLIDEINIDMPEVESLANKAITKMKALFEKQ